MYTDEQLDQLEQEEHSITEEAILAMVVTLGVSHYNLEKELRDFYSKYGKDGVVSYNETRKWVSKDDHRRRLTVLLLSISAIFADLENKLVARFDNLLHGVISKESEFFKVGLSADDILFTGWGADELNWLARLEDDVALWKWYVSKATEQGFLRRQNLDGVLAELNKRYVSIEKVLKRLALTESTAMGSIARKQIFKELGVEKYRFYAREDERICDECGALHGLVFPISAYEVGKTASPIHAHCRCWEVPILD